MGLVVRCKRWSCVACIDWLKACWQQNLWDRLHCCTGPIHVWQGEQQKREAVTESIRRWAKGHSAPVEFCTVVLPAGRLLVVSPAPISGAQAVTPQVAAQEVVAAIEAVPLKARRPVSASHEWKLPDIRSGEWLRLAQPVDLEEVHTFLRALGVGVLEGKPRGGPDGGVQQQFFYEFPAHWSEEEVEYAVAWAHALTLPDGHVAGDPPPDPRPVLEERAAGG
jgi:hypothetical protein